LKKVGSAQSDLHQPVWCAPDSVRCPGWSARRTRCSREKLGTMRLKFTGPSGEPAVLAPTVGSAISAEAAGDAWPVPTVTRPHRTVRCTTRAGGCNGRLRQRRKEITTVHCPVGHQTVRCAHGQKATIAYQMELQRLLAALGLYERELGLHLAPK
jgi:hypothetical protein